MDETNITTGSNADEPLPERSRRSDEADWRADDDLPRRWPDSSYEQDRQHLNLLMIFHFVLAGMMFLFGLCPLLYVGFGLFIVSGGMPLPPTPNGGGPSMEVMGWIMVGEFGFFFVMLYGEGILATLVGYYLKKRKRWLFCLVGASILCLFMPFGTVLGVFTIIVLVRQSVKNLFKYGEPLHDDEDYA